LGSNKTKAQSLWSPENRNNITGHSFSRKVNRDMNAATNTNK